MRSPAALLLCCCVLAGCRSKTIPIAMPVTARNHSTGTKPAAVPVLGTAPLPFNLGRTELGRAVVARYYDRIMAHRSTPRDVARMINDIAPLIRAAAKQPQAQRVFRQMANERVASTQAECEERWIAVQEADILLESGGDPDARSSSDAVGVAQWLAGTATGVGLPVNRPESDHLTGIIDALNRQIAWLDYVMRPDADHNAPGFPALTPSQAAAQLPELTARRDLLREKRRTLDARYDARKSILAQTRYLLRLYTRFPAIDWLFQAYHGGEGGVIRTLKDYTGAHWTNVTSAIRNGNHGSALRFEDLYFTTTPRSHPLAFAYLYGRSDDHRHYWWKIRASEEVLALYRRDPEGFQRQWLAHFPGRGQEALWYPDAPAMAYLDLESIRTAQSNGNLLPITANPTLRIGGDALIGLPSPTLALLAPEAKGLLALLGNANQNLGGSDLNVGDTTLTPSDIVRKRALIAEMKARKPQPRAWPPDPDAHSAPGGGPSPDFDYHTTGIAFDLWKPADPAQRKLLDYVIGYFEDRNILWHAERKDMPVARYHIVPNPQFGQALARIALTGNTPTLSGL